MLNWFRKKKSADIPVAKELKRVQMQPLIITPK